MLYYLFDITVVVDGEFATEICHHNVTKEYPDGTPREFVEVDAERIMDEYAEADEDEFCGCGHGDDPDVRSFLDAYTLTENEYYKINKELEENEKGLKGSE